MCIQDTTTMAYLIGENDPRKALGVPEQLVDIVIPDDLMMVPFPPHILSIHRLIPLITHAGRERVVL